MGTQTAKQYLELQGKPILVYALEVFEQSAVVDDILLMTDKDHVEYCKKEICEKYGIKKVSAVAPGGKERYESVWKALCILKERGQSCIPSYPCFPVIFPLILNLELHLSPIRSDFPFYTHSKPLHRSWLHYRYKK